MKRIFYVILMVIISLSILNAAPTDWLKLSGSAITPQVIQDIQNSNRDVRGPSFNFTSPYNLPTTAEIAVSNLFLEDTSWTKDFTTLVIPAGGTYYLYYSNPEHFTITQDLVNPLILTFAPKPLNWNGSEMVILTVSDVPLGRESRAYSTAIIRLNVTPVPDPPILNFPLIFPPEFLEDTTLTVNFADYVQCVDSAPNNFDLYLSQTQLPPYNVEISQVPANIGQIVTFTPKHDFNGEVNFVLTAVDRTTSALVSTTITVDVQAVNDAPVIDSFIPILTNQNIEQYSTLNFSIVAHDVDLTPLDYSWTVSGTHNGVPFSDVFSTLSTGAYTFNFPGLYTVEVDVNDGVNHVHQTWNVTVAPTGPIFNPWGGVYLHPVSVTLTPPAEYPTAPIYYTINGTLPDNTSLLFNPANPILISAGLNNDNIVTVKAIYYETGLPPSSIITQNYQITGTVHAPVFSPDPAVYYPNAQQVHISTPTIGASIYYTIDGTDPVVGAPNTFLYSDLTPIDVPLNTTKVIKAIAMKTDWQASSIVTATYNVTGTVVISHYEFNPSPGHYDVPLGDVLDVNINNIVLAPMDAVLHYTIDNSIPTTSSPVYNAGHTFIFSTPTTIRIRAFKTNWQPSDIISVEYDIAGQVVIDRYPDPNNTVFNPAPGIFSTSQNVTINSTIPPGGSIYYSLDGSDPVVGGLTTFQYFGPVLITSSKIIKAIATYSGLRQSPVYQGGYTITGTVATPAFMPPAGVYPSSQEVEISCATPGASIYYTLENNLIGSEPVIGAANTFLYTAPFTVTVPVGYSTLKARAFLNTWEPSAITTGIYSIARLPMPSFNLVSGTYPVSQTIHITDVSERAAKIYYTLDGTDPTEDSNLYNDISPIVLAENTTTIIRARAFKAGWNPSDVAARTYTITGTVSDPQFAPPSGTYPLPTDVSIFSTTPGSTIRYTTNGVVPTPTFGTVYSDPIHVSSGLTIKAIAYQADWNNSNVTEATYIISGIVGNPVFTPPAGIYANAQQVYLGVSPIDASIIYTIDGSDPSEIHGTLFNAANPILVSSSHTTIKAFAYKLGWTSSQIVTADYYITGAVAAPTFDPAGGEYASAQSVNLNCTTPGASIRYTVDGALPSATVGIPYDPLIPILITQSTNVRAVAYKTDWITSPVSNAIYTINGIISSPIFSPIGGSYNSPKFVSIRTFPVDATIRYTTDGSIPTEIYGTEFVSGNTIPIGVATTINAIAYKNNWQTSLVSTASYSFNVDSPVFTPSAGVYAGNQTISISCPTSLVTDGISIRYTINGPDPTPTIGIEYLSSFEISSSPTTIRAIAYKTGWNNSPVVISTYVINGAVRTPEFSVAPGTYLNTFNVSISTMPTDATIYYTLDGSIPTDHSDIYNEAIPITRSTILKAIAYKSAYLNSGVAEANYILKVTKPVFSPLPNTFNTAQTITLTTPTPGAQIRYTLDGVTTPSSAIGTFYAGPFSINSNTTIRAIAFMPTFDWENSDVAEGVYMFNLNPPTFSPSAGQYDAAQSITLSAGTASIRYTLDGTDPSDVNGLPYNSPILLTEATTIRAIAYMAGWNNSTIAIAPYTFKVATPIFSRNPLNIYGSAQDVAISTSTDGAAIRYTTNGVDPTETDGLPYVGSIHIDGNTLIKAVAYKTNWISSRAEANYKFEVAKPEFTPPSGTYTTAQSVSLSSPTSATESGVEIRYTVDGPEPTPLFGTVYVAGSTIDFPINTSRTIKAIAYKSNWQNSVVNMAVYLITGTVTMSEPVFSVLSGTYQSAQDVSILSSVFPADAVIHYTTDGSVPTEASPVYAGAVTVPLATITTIKVRAFKADWIPSAIYSETYNVTGKIAIPTPLFTPAAGDYLNAQFVTLNTSTTLAGTHVYYTLDGSDPTEASPEYVFGSQIVIPQGATTTLRVRAFRVDWIPSDIATAVYHISNKVVFNQPVFNPPAGLYATSQSVVINTAIPAEATVHYTINGTDPTLASPVYTIPIIVAGNSPLVIKACAFAPGFADSNIETAVYNANVVPTPIFSLASGTYTEFPQFLTISVPEEGATIRYTLDGSEPTATSTLYSGVITLNTNNTYTFKAKAFKDTWVNSLTASATYIITGTLPSVVFNPVGGTYPVSQNIILTSPVEGTSIHYTIDGNDPNAASPLYSAPINLALGTNTTVKAIAMKYGWVNSNVRSEVYNITGQVVFSLPVFTPVGGVYSSAQSVTISSPTPPDATVKYTVDGSDPSELNGTTYTVPFTVNASQTIKAIAYKSDWISSSIASVSYDITGLVADVTFDIPGGIYQEAKNITLTSLTPGAVIRYTTNGSEPSEASATFTGAITIPLNSTMVIKAKAYKANWITSSTTSQTYTITGQVVFNQPVFTPVAGNYTTAQTINLNTVLPADAIIKYTTDGTEPNLGSFSYLAPLLLPLNNSLNLKVKAFKLDWTPSETYSASYNVTGQVTIAQPIFTPDPGLFQTPQTIHINTSVVPADAVIHYTLDGSNPIESSPVYTDPISIGANQQLLIKIRAYAANWIPGEIQSGLFTVTDQVAQVAFNPVGGTYSTVQNVLLTTPTDGATIRFTTDGSEPNEGSTIFTSTITIPLNTSLTIKAKAFKTSWTPSITTSQSYVINSQVVFNQPIFTPAGGTYSSDQTVSINTTLPNDATIKYTVDGSTPSLINGIVYGGPILINANTTLKVKAYKDNWQDSEIAQATYVFQTDNPILSLASGTYATSQTLTITSPTVDSQVRYTIDGTAPSALNGTIYLIPIPINNSQTVKAIAYKTGWNPSAIVSGIYEITGQVADVTFSTPGGTYQTAQNITLSTMIVGAAIRYTTDGSEPDETSATYLNSIYTPFNSTTTIKAKAYKTNWNPSTTTSQTYIITGQVAFNHPVFNPPAGIYTTAQTISLNTVLPADAVIKYTIDGSEPDMGSYTYAAPWLLPLNSTLDLKIKAFKTDWTPSLTYSAFYTITGQVTMAQPVFDPAPGLYATAQAIHINTNVTPASAVIHYTVDGSTPTESSPVYGAPISVGPDQQMIINVRAFAANWIPGDIQTGVYNITDIVAPVTFTPLGGNFTTSQNILLSTTTDGATIHYTTDGNEPSSGSALYTSAIVIPLNTSMTIKAKAFKTNWTNSVTTSQTYVVSGQVAFAQPVFSPAGGVYTSSRNITISAPIPADATIRYTTDGSEPSESNGTIYTVPISVGASQTIKAIAYKANWISSAIASASYEITGQVADVTFGTPGGTYQTAQNITLSTVTTGAVIRFTLDGSDPNEFSASYNAPINIPLNTIETIKAKAYKTNWITSSTTSQAYIITGQIAFNQPVFNPLAGIYTSPQMISLNTVLPADAVIRYTTDGTEPNLGSRIYAAPWLLPLNSILILQVKAFKEDWIPSLTYSASFEITGQVTMSQPVFDPAPGLYATPQTIHINTNVTPATAVIHYTIDGSIPTESSPVYGASINIAANQQMIISVRAFAANWIPGDIQTGVYNITDMVAPVTFTPMGGNFTTSQNVLLNTTTDGATIHYTIDGTEPSIASELYTTAIAIPLNTSLTINAKGFKTNWTNSITTSQTYVVTGQVAFAQPVFTPAGGVYTSSRNVTINSPIPADATIRYTTDNTDPSESNGTIYTIPILVDATQTIKAIAYKANWISSSITSASYEITGQVADVTFGTLGGTYQIAQNITLSTVTVGADIRFTTDGSEPSEASASYTAPINVPLNSTETIKTKAFKTNWDPSNTTSQTYVITGQVTMAQPVFTPGPGLYTTPQTISINSSVIPVDAVIHYTIDGTIPNESSPVYLNPIGIGANQQMEIKVRAYAANWIPGNVQSGLFIITGQVSDVAFNPLGGTYTTAQNVLLSTATDEATIHYTTDGSEPTTGSPVYSSSIPVPLNTNMTIRAKAFKTNWLPSNITSQSYVITGQVAFNQPIFTPAAGIFTTAQSVSINAPIPVDATIRYTTDGTDPSESVGTIYAGSINVNSTQTIKAIAYKADWTSSVIVSAAYEITGQVSNVTFNPLGGTYQTAQDVTLSTATSGAVIRYTLDGSEPSEASASYTAAINIPVNTTMTIKAKAFKTNWDPSAATTQTYVITGQIVFNQPVFNPSAGIYTSVQTISLNTVLPADAVIKYTTDGTEPSLGSFTYSAPWSLPLNSTLDLKVKAFKTDWISSLTYSASYIVTGQVTMTQPVYSPIPGLYTTPQLISIISNVTPSNAVIHYTIDGTSPTESSPIYLDPISIGANQQMIINARAYANNWIPSDVQTGVYNITDMVAPVAFNPLGGTYTTAQNVFLTTATDGATIRYTTDGSEPNTGSPVYSSSIPVPLNTNMTIRAKAFKTNWTPSNITSQSYVITGQVAFNQPIFTPAAGIFTTAQSVSINAPIPVDATIRYTIDGTDPSESVGTIYAGSINVNSTQTIKAIAYKADWTSSVIVSAAYEITGQVSNVTFNPLGGTYQTAQDVTLSTATSGADIRYTLDGSEPSEASASYTAAINIPVNTTMTIKAKAFKTNWDPSGTTTQTYVITGQIVFNQPMFSPASGTYTSAQTINLNTVIPSDAVIRYTTDGNDPIQTSAIYTPQTVPLSSSLNLKVKAFKTDWISSLTYSASYIVTGQVTMTQPVYSPIPGLYTTPQLISIISNVTPSNAVIHYTIDGTSPTESSPIYLDPISIGANQQMIINARAYANNWIPSDVQTGVYNITDMVAPVAFNPLGGTYTTAQNVFLTTATDGATIRYTTDGSEPNTGSPVYSSSIPVPLNTNMTIRAKAFKTNWTPSNITSQSYVITGQVAFNQPIFTPAAGIFTTAQSVSINAPIPVDATIRYTIDGTDPGESVGTIYAGSINVNSTQTIKAIAYKADWTSSVIVSAAYEITGQVSNVTFNPLGGTYQTAQDVTLSTATSGADIRYTLDGSEPSEASASYTAAINIPVNTTMTIKAKAFKTNWDPSGTTTQTYVITGQIVFNQPVFNPSAGIYTSVQTISLNTVLPADAVIKYTTDGTEPSLGSFTYSAPWLLPLNSTLDLKVKAFKTDWISSLTYSASYIVTGQVTMAQPVYSPIPGLYTTPQLISIISNVTPSNAVIHYTIDGTSPTESSPIYLDPISIGANQQMIINARAYANNWIPSDVQTGVYNITDMVAPVAFNPLGGTYATEQDVFLTTATDGATIRYTTNGSEPNTGSILYTSAITLQQNTNVTIKAKAFKTNWTTSNTTSQSYVITGQVAFNQPIFTPAAGIFATAQSVSINTPIPADATIRYTTDGTDPSETVGTIYAGSITVSTSQVIKAIAYKANWTSSVIVAGTFEITGTVAPVTFNPNGGTYTSSQNIFLSTTTEAASIRYTTDGSEPNSGSTPYISAITVPFNTSMVIKAKAFKSNWIPSITTTQTYVVTGQVVFNQPVFTPAAGIYSSVQTVTIAAPIPADATVRYTIDGTDPSESVGSIYVGSITVSSSQIIKAIAYKANWTSSIIAVGAYEITGIVEPVTFNPSGGTYATMQNVFLSTTTESASIRYTTDGSEPTSLSTLYTSAIMIPINTSMTIKAKAYKTNWTPSIITTQSYIITGQVVLNQPVFTPVAGIYSTEQTVTISTPIPSDATIRYTIDGTDPSETVGTIYTGSITVSTSHTIKVIAYKANWTSSVIAIGTYEITGTVAPVAFNPNGGSFTSAQSVVLTTSTFEATIRYTTDGTEPTSGSTLYTASIIVPLNTSMTIKAKAFKTNWNPSNTTTQTYVVTGQVVFNQPAFLPVSGVYASTQTVTVNTPNPSDAIVRYTIDGSNPSETVGTIYTGPITVNTSQTIKAIAYKTNWISSIVTSANYEITGQVASVTFGTPGGTYQTTQDVTLSTTTADAVIHYTTDGSNPSEASAPYFDPINVPLNTTMTIKAIAYKTNWLPSLMTAQIYTVTGQVAINQPVFSIPAGTYTSTQEITVNTAIPTDAIITYTLDGTEPTISSTPYTVPLNVQLNSSMDLRVKAFKTDWISSQTYSSLYTVTGQVTMTQPVFTPEPGLYMTAQQISINTNVIPATAVIHYTLDGSSPTESSPVYETAISIGTNQQVVINTRAFANDWLPSDVQTGIYNITDQVAPVSFNPLGGTFQVVQNVLLTTATDGASIRYTTDGSEPTVSSTLYTSAVVVPLNSNMTIKAIAYKTNWTPSVITTQSYVVTGQVAFTQPTFSPAGGIYTSARTVTISSPIPADATVRYTTDGTNPSETVGTIYTGTISVSSTQTIKAIAYKTNWTSSSIASASYEITGQVAAVTFSIPGGTYQTAQNVALSTTTSESVIRYTLDGSEPSEASASYTSPIVIPLNTGLQINAKAFKTNWDPSITTLETYVITGQVAFNTPVFNPIAGIYTSAQTLAINTVFPTDASIRFTTDGTDPSSTVGTLYTQPIAIDSTQTIKVIAYKTDWISSAVMTSAYVITGQVAPVAFSLPGDTYQTAQTVALSTMTIDALIRFTTDSSEPNVSSTVYTTPIQIPLNTTMLIKAKAFKTDWIPSETTMQTYVVTGNVIFSNPPIFSLAEGTYSTAQVVSLGETSPADAQINYTLDGSTPSATNGTLYIAPITLNANTILKVIAFKNNWVDSDPAQAAYNFQTADPVLSNTSGIYSEAFSLTLSCTTENAVIHYTTNGTEPDASSPIYTDGIPIVDNVQGFVVKGKAFKDNWLTSTSVSGTYSVLLLPVNVRANSYEGYIRISWNSPIVGRALDGFNVYRKQVGDPGFTKINTSGLVNTYSPQDTVYYFDDYTIQQTQPGQSNESYQYYVTAVYSGVESNPSNYTTIEYVTQGQLISAATHVYPNPATNSCKIQLVLSRRDNVQLTVTIYDFAGKKVQTLIVPISNSNKIEIPWDLTTSGGAKVARGAYFARVVANNGTDRSEKIIKIAVK